MEIQQLKQLEPTNERPHVHKQVDYSAGPIPLQQELFRNQRQDGMPMNVGKG